VCGCSPREALVSYALNWINTQLDTGGNDTPVIPEDCSTILSKGILAALTSKNVQLFNETIIMISKYAEKLNSQEESPDPVTLDFFLTLTAIPNANQISIMAIHHHAASHPESVLNAMTRSVSTMSLNDVLALHSCVLKSSLPPDIMKTLFSNTVQQLCLRPVAPFEKESITFMLQSVVSKFPEAAIDPLLSMIESEDPITLKQALRHIIGFGEYHSSMLVMEHFKSILVSASPVGQMVFLWECTSMLIDPEHSDRSPWTKEDEVRGLISHWSTTVIELLNEGVFAESKTPVLTILGKFLFEILKNTPPTNERPLWTDEVLKWAQRSESDILDKVLWDDFFDIYNIDIDHGPGMEIHEDETVNDLVAPDVCPWGSACLTLDDKFNVVNGRDKHAPPGFSAAFARRFSGRTPCIRDDLSAVTLLLIERLSQYLVDKELQTLASLPWRKLSYDKNQHVIKAAAVMMMMQAQQFPTVVRELLCTEMYSQQSTVRSLGLKRFGNLWRHREHLSRVYVVTYQSMEKPVTLPDPIVGLVSDEDLATKGQELMLPPIFGIAVSPIIDLCQDESTAVSMLARKVLRMCLADDTELIMRVTFEQVGYVGDMARSQMIARCISIIQQLHQPPAIYVCLLFNFVITLLVEWQQSGSAFVLPFDTLRCVTLLIGLVPHMNYIRLKDIRATARAPFLIQPLDLTLEFETDKTRHTSAEEVRGLLADHFLQHVTDTAKFTSVFPNDERPHKHQQLREVQAVMGELVHQAKLIFALRILQEFPDQQVDMKNKLLAEGQHLLQEQLIDCYRSHTEAKSRDDGIKRKEVDSMFVFQEIKRVIPATFHHVLSQTTHTTQYLWLLLGKLLLPCWNDCGFSEDDKSVHTLVGIITCLNMIILKHSTLLHSVVEAVTVYCQLVLQHYRFFREDGYRHCIHVLAKVYEMRMDHSEIKACLEFMFGHFYRVHGQAFLLQALACLGPTVVGDVLKTDSRSIVSLISSLRMSSDQSKYNHLCWTPQLTGEAHFNLEEVVKTLVCLVIHSPTLPGTAVFFEMLEHLISGLQQHPDWEGLGQGQKFLSSLKKLLESLDPRVYNINFGAIPTRFKVCLFRYVQRLGKIDAMIYNKYYHIAHECVASLLTDAFERDQELAVNWLHEYCEDFICHIDRQKYEVFGPIRTLITSCLEVFRKAPVWGAWASVFHSLTGILREHPDVCDFIAKDVLETVADTLWKYDMVEPRVVLSAIELFSFVACRETGLTTCVPVPLLLSSQNTDNVELRAQDFLVQVVMPMAHSMSLHAISNSTYQHGWSWPMLFILDCLHERRAIEQSLLTLQVVLAFGHPCLGRWSACITAIVSAMFADEDHPSTAVAKLLQNFLHFVILLKPNLYLTLLPIVKRYFGASRLVSIPGGDKLPVSEVMKLSPCTTSEMLEWMEPSLGAAQDLRGSPASPFF